MSSLRRIVDKLVFGFTSRLRDYEHRCLEDTFASLGEGTRRTLEAQLASLERVQRFNSDRQVNLFFAPNGARLPNLAEDLTIARLTYRPGDYRLRVHVVAHRGWLSSLEFSSPPRRAGLNSATPVEVKILADLCKADEPAGVAGLATKNELSALIASDLPFEDVEAPATVEQVVRLREEIGRLEDLEKLLSVSNGWICRGWRFHGTHLRDVPRAGAVGTLRVVAESQTLMIGLGAVTSKRWVLYDGINEDDKIVRGDLLELLRQALQEV